MVTYKVTYKEDMQFQNICLYETGKVAVSARTISSDVQWRWILVNILMEKFCDRFAIRCNWALDLRNSAWKFANLSKLGASGLKCFLVESRKLMVLMIVNIWIHRLP